MICDLNFMVLEELLKEVKKLKSERYVGTKEALNYIRAKRELEERPRKITEEVNRQLGEVNYQATPERIVAIHKICDDIDNINNSSIFEWVKCVDLYKMETPFFNYSTDKKQITTSLSHEYISNFVEVLKKANESGVKTNDEFFDFMMNKYLPSQLKQKKSKKKRIKTPDKFNFGVTYEEVKDYSTAFILNEIIKSEKIIKRMQIDKVEFKTEHRKQIIDHNLGRIIEYVTHEVSKYKPEETSKDFLYKSIIKLLDDKLRERKERTDNLKEVSKFMLNLFKDSLNEARMLREVFGREKNYVLNKLELFLGR